MTQLNILQLHRTITEKKQRKHEAFEKVLNICHRRIKTSAEYERLKTIIVVPEFIVGYPIFNMNECLEFVIHALKKNGFLVKYFFPKILYVSWDFEEIDIEKKQITAPVTIMQPKSLLTSNITTNKHGKYQLNL
jgi:hypothetical protein